MQGILLEMCSLKGLAEFTLFLKHLKQADSHTPKHTLVVFSVVEHNVWYLMDHYGEDRLTFFNFNSSNSNRNWL